MNFGLDNEYESDDSFFDEPKLTKKNSLTKNGKHKSVDDLFGSLEDKKHEKTSTSLENVTDLPNKPKVRFDLPATSQDEVPAKSTTLSTKNVDWLGQSSPEPAKKSLSSRESKSLDILDDILAPSTKSDKKSSSSGILDDILPRPTKQEKKISISFEDILKESKLASTTTILPQTEIKPPPQPQKRTGVTLEPPREGRRGRRGSNTGLEDVLGLFSGELEPETKKSKGVGKSLETAALRAATSEDTPDWLGSTVTTNISDTTISTAKSETAQVAPSKLEVEKVYDNPRIKHGNVPDKTEQLQISSQNLQNSFVALQQQESFLLVSMQLKKYEENLNGIKKQQDQILAKQEDQFEQFLNVYIAKQQAIEENMMKQQKRINEHIKNLIHSDSGVSLDTSKSSKSGNDEEENQEMESSLIKSLRQRHSEEFFLMEESYKKQILLLEKSSEALEARLANEISSITESYEEKIRLLKREQENDRLQWEEKINLFKDNHGKELANLKEHHIRLVNDLKDEHLDQIKRLRESKSKEIELVSSGLEFSQKLDGNLQTLNSNSQILKTLQEKVVSDYSVLSAAREQSLQAKEQEIIQMRSTLERCRESAEKERSQLLGLVRNLEEKLSQQSINSQEERWALQQAAATLAARSSAMDREAEFSRATIEREREQLKTLKEALLQEQERITLQLTEEKLQIAAEKSRIDITSKLVKNYEIDKIKAEAQTAIDIARELTEELNQERDYIQRQKTEVDNLRRKLAEKERKIADREMDLKSLSQNVESKLNEDRGIIREAKYLEDRYKEKLTELQAQALSISTREKKLSEEKLSVSKERLALYTAMKQKRCMLCKAEDEQKLMTGFEGGQVLDHPGSMAYIPQTMDPELLRLRMEAMANDDKNSEVSREDSQKITI